MLLSLRKQGWPLGKTMEYNADKVDKMVLALIYLGLHDGNRVWKTFDWDSLNRLFAKALISNPINQAKSIILTPEGKKKAEKLFKQYFLT